MDPYLEGDMWQEFHDRLANQISMHLMPQLAPKYVALLAKRYVMSRPALAISDIPTEKVLYPDVNGLATTSDMPAAPASTVTITPPAGEYPNVIAEEVPVVWVEIRDVAERRLVTVIEIISPVNKFGEGFDDYLHRRDLLLLTQTHILEIDLLRRGKRLPFRHPLPPAPYYIFLSRTERRPNTQFWTVSLRQPLPVIPAPLLSPDPDASVDLQAALDACFELVGYERLLDYAAAPPPPDLEADDATWVEELLRQAGRRP
jgi:hypothetical protein